MKKIFQGAVRAPSELGAGQAAGAGSPKPLSVTKAIDIAASADAVWAIIAEFADIVWLPLVKGSSATDGNTLGSIRTVDLGGPHVIEELIGYDAAKRSYSYKFTDDPNNVNVVPAGNYHSTITVQAQGDGARVVWQGFFTRVSPLADPPAGQGDTDAINAITGIYESGLGGIKQRAEA